MSNGEGEIILRVAILRAGEVREFVNLFQALERVYNSLYAFDLVLNEVRENYGYRYSRSRSIRIIKKPEQVVLPEDRLRLYRISVNSPGWVDVIGKINHLETLRQYLNDRNERRKDLTYRDSAERDRLDLENQKRAIELEKLKTAVVSERIKVLKEISVPEDKIRQAVMSYFFQPVEELEQLQDSNLIGGAETKRKQLDQG